MSRKNLTRSFPWTRYSKKLINKIENPRNVGLFTAEDAALSNMRLVEGEEGSLLDGNIIRFYWLVNEEDGVIADAKFQVLGQSALIGAAEVACELLLRKNYDQARRIGADLIDKELRDKSDLAAFPPETNPHINLVIGAIDHASEKCSDIPLPKNYVSPPKPMEIGEVLEGGYPGWADLSAPQKISLIEQVLDQEVRPYIALDGGGVELLDLVNGKDVIVKYQGNCTSCFSSTGATLSYIQGVLRAKVHPDLSVIPEL